METVVDVVQGALAGAATGAAAGAVQGAVGTASEKMGGENDSQQNESGGSGETAR